MSQTFGSEKPRAHSHAEEQPPVRFVVLIDSANSGGRLARLFLSSREPVAEFEAAAPEVLTMTRDLAATQDALQSEWDGALAGHSEEERRGAEIYSLEI